MAKDEQHPQDILEALNLFDGQLDKMPAVQADHLFSVVRQRLELIGRKIGNRYAQERSLKCANPKCKKVLDSSSALVSDQLPNRDGTHYDTYWFHTKQCQLAWRQMLSNENQPRAATHAA